MKRNSTGTTRHVRKESRNQRRRAGQAHAKNRRKDGWKRRKAHRELMARNEEVTNG